MSPSRREGHAVLDRQNLPVWTGIFLRSGTADFAGLSIEEYAFKNTQNE